MKIQALLRPRTVRIALGASFLAGFAWAAVLAGPARADTATFTTTGFEQTFTVPAGVTSVHVVAVGGRGGAAISGSPAGGAAAMATADMSVTPGQVLYVEVAGIGQSGDAAAPGGFNGGGAGGGNNAGGGAGGGASDVRSSPRAAASSLDTRLIVAAGGGGGGTNGNSETGGAGGAAGSAGADESGAIVKGGGAGASTAGGSGGFGINFSGSDGQVGLGGAGATDGRPGGGGGGGYYGGGGGGAAVTQNGGGGGGGGSSLVPAGGSVVVAAAGAAPQIQITYTPPGAPGAPGAPGGAVPDRTKPVVTSSSTSARLSRTGAISFFLRADEGSSGPATATVNVPNDAKVLRFRRRNVTLRPNVRTRVTLKLARRNAAKARRALRQRRRLRARVSVTLRDAAGNATTTRLSLRLRR